jgi:hypothetical protein
MARELQRATGDARSESPTLIALILEMIALRHQIAVVPSQNLIRANSLVVSLVWR